MVKERFLRRISRTIHPDFTTLTDNQPDSLKIFSMMEIIVLIVILSKILILPWMKMVIICLMMRGISY